MTAEKAAGRFWDWFSANADEFGDSFENKELLSQLDSWIASLGNFGWEIGPGKSAPNALVLSPGGDRSLLREAKSLVSAAPPIAGWEFYPAKPAKEWIPQFEIQDDLGVLVGLDASDWQCVLLRYSDGFREAVVRVTGVKSLSEVYRQWAVEIALDCLLGEERRLQSVDKVTVVDEFSRRELASSFPIVEVRERL